MVSQMLPAVRLFDVVIFDEASQVMPADAIPALARGRQIVVAGDSHQLPPSDFFAKLMGPGASDGSSEDEDTDEDDADITATPPQTRDLESILDTLDIVLAGQSRTLTWHYRSKDEKLIATSNEYVYHRQLITFPGADNSDRIRFEEAEWSTGLGKYNKSPSAEISRVVELTLEHAATRPYESLGIIAFGSDHAKRIESALNDRLGSEPTLRDFFREGGLESFFIKNIERVQGDEREAIIITPGYGKSSDGKMRYIWGPLLEAGGERRLNVAITRARSRLALVTSFGPDDLDPTANNSAGFQLMYRFVQFMSSGGNSFGSDPGRNPEMNPFEVDVFNRLTAAGLSMEPQWGVGAYRLDFAVRHPDKPGRFILALECDGAMYHSGIVARERDRIRQQQLERLGWRFHRIWSTDWWNNPQPQIEAVLSSYAAAIDEDEDNEASNLVPTTVPSLDPSNDAATLTTTAGAPALERTGPRPQIRRGDPITSYSHAQLVRLISWIKSDDIVRTDEELLLEAMKALGLKRRGARIVDALTSAIRAVK
jgi:very-short-patch-repair endonuclease